ncbi:FecCD family ABC transporter permease [Arenibacterium halophilum]|uniref:Iron ABC transporter permease n=1 Tax=Arenibacterium halophilum TaxID=2583821 RepID=A0ABY2X9H3_9RHOB|nr:iron ABC transporter permease [Arenibacterium halophilum]TMV13032.1 iron ABC transporter permease [Arenibacterium halophilum]
MTAETQHIPSRLGDRADRAWRLHRLLWLLLLLACALSMTTGAAGAQVRGALLGWINGDALDMGARIILFDIRLPRLFVGILVGAGLAVSGAVMQGLFRNPLADPGLVGVSAGASLGAISAIVLGAALPPALLAWLGPALLPLAAFLGGWVTTIALYRISTRAGRTSVATMLLAGIAMSALAFALTGLLTYLADDQQLRDLTFWNLGSLAGATWPKVWSAAAMILPAIVAAPLLARGLNGLALGEAAAMHMGIPLERLKTGAILIVAFGTGAAVAVAGTIGFIGIVVPHLLRLASGPDHRALLPNAALLGAALLILADCAARVLIAPAELPIGIVTALMGAPVFLWIVLRNRGAVDI